MFTGRILGVDGGTNEFCRVFLKETSYLVLDSLNEAYRISKLTTSQNRGIICLLPKPKKRIELSKLTVGDQYHYLNVNIKTGSKALAIQLKKVLSSIIHSDKTGFFRGRTRKMYTHNRV